MKNTMMKCMEKIDKKNRMPDIVKNSKAHA